jgi:orotate phosphoribosyltransferase
MQEELRKLLAGRRGHFQMESGYHSDAWFELDRLFAQPAKLRPFVAELARRLAVHRPQAVCGPMTGGAKLAEALAAELGATYLFTARIESPDATGLFPVKYELPTPSRSRAHGMTVAIVDDAISAGSAVRGTYANLVVHGVRPVALGALFIFGQKAARFAAEKNLPLEGIAQLEFNIWSPNDCPLCHEGVALERVSDASP